MSNLFANGEELAKIKDLADLFNGNFKNIKQFSSGLCANAPYGLSFWQNDNNAISDAPNKDSDWFALIKWQTAANSTMYLAIANHLNSRFRMYVRWSTGKWYQLADSQNGE